MEHRRMNAEEMFKELGYRCFKYSNNTLYEHDTEAALEFDKTRKELIILYGKTGQHNLNQKQLKAITKQMEELGWLND
jgi:hypothetical protein